MARRMNLAPRMDFNGPPMMNFDGPPRMHYSTTRIDYNMPFRQDYNYEMQQYRGGPRPRGPNYMENEDDYRRPMMRVHCGELREHHVGMDVEICGRVKKQQLGRFITLKDVNGMTQLVVPESKQFLVRKISNIALDSYIVVNGTVNKRPKHQRNSFMNTGNVEVAINRILNIQSNKFKNNFKAIAGAQQARNLSTTSESLALTSEEYTRCNSQSVSSQFSKRTHNCGQLNVEHVGKSVTLCGWIEYNKSKFLQIKDGYGLVQVVIPSSNGLLSGTVRNFSVNTIVQVQGTVSPRPEQQKNVNIPTGEIEIHAEDVKRLIPIEGEDEEMQVDKPDTEIVGVNSFTTRSHNCNELREEHIGQTVRLSGWLEYHRVGKFVILRDGYGRTQLMIPDERKDIQQLVDSLPHESVIEATGMVTSRPINSQQSQMSTGKIEVVISDLKVISEAKSVLPFNVREYNKAKEPLRMEYRYLDLRFPEMQRNLRVRSKFIMDMRDFLINQGKFIEVETPTLFKPTPGGAQEFIVPTRNAGQVYSLVQSPQQFKQMLMAGAIDRYFQVARCYRDEGARPDRQPEFTQLDVEMSFTTVDGVLSLIEKVLKHSWPEIVPSIHIPFKKLTYDEAMTQYGSDKPDLRIHSKMIDCTEIIKTNAELVKVEDDVFAAHALVFKKPHNALTVALKNRYEEVAKAYPNTKLVQARFSDNVEFTIGELSKCLGETVPKTLVENLQLEPECVLLLAYGTRKEVLPLLGKLRIMYADNLEEKGVQLRNKEEMHLLWIVDFPLFEKDDNGELVSAHHPFTAPHPDDLEMLKTDSLKVRGQSYDLVLNGCEVGGGSIRIHDPKLQSQILEMLKIDTSSMKHFLDALSSGCPPHGGIALGLDRLLATMLDTNSIRDVIAFPKGVEGKDPLSGAPVTITDKDKELYHLKFVVNGEPDNDLLKNETESSK